MSGGNRRRAPERLGVVLALTLLCAGCAPARELRPRYLPDFVPGALGEFAPATIAIAPPTGDHVIGRAPLGAIYSADRRVKTRLYTRDFGALLARGLARSLADAGLKPAILSTAPGANDAARGSDFILFAAVQELAVNKHFGSRVTVHGRYFTMTAQVRLAFTLRTKDGAVVYSGAILGEEHEPPRPAHHEEFLPLETDPARSLSIALSRAIGMLVLEPGFRHALPASAARRQEAPVAHRGSGGVGNLSHF